MLNQLGVNRIGAHHVGPLGPLGVSNLNSDGAALSQAVTHTTEDAHAVLLELHAGTAAVAQTAASQGVTHHVAGEFHTGGNALNDADERLAVGFSGSEPTKSHRLTSFHRTRTGAQVEGIIILQCRKCIKCGLYSASGAGRCSRDGRPTAAHIALIRPSNSAGCRVQSVKSRTCSTAW